MIRSAIERRGSSASGLADTKVSAADLVTETDVAIENAIRSRIASTFPEHIIVGEEGTGDFVGESDRKGRFVWIIDPIDGTTNFVHAFPVVAVSIGVAFGDELVMGVVYNPLTDELWFAWKGCGAFFRRSSGTVSRIHIQVRGCRIINRLYRIRSTIVPSVKRPEGEPGKTHKDRRAQYAYSHDENERCSSNWERGM